MNDLTFVTGLHRDVIFATPEISKSQRENAKGSPVLVLGYGSYRHHYDRK